MPALTIETATAACSVALIEGAEVVARAHEVVGRGHAERLIPMIRDLIAGRAPPSALIVDCGPGSFTGVRVGLAAARAFALAWAIPIRGYSSLALLAAMAGEREVAVAITGGHGELFVQSFFEGSPIDTLRSLSPIEAAREFTAAIVVGSGARLLVAARGYGEARDLLPDAAEAWRLDSTSAGLPPSPIYGRAPDAKVAA